MKNYWNLAMATGSLLAISLAALLTGATFAGNDALLDEPAVRCAKPSASEDVITSGDFKWDFRLDEMRAKFAEMYKSTKRLQHRAYFDPAKGAYVMPSQNIGAAEIVVPQRLIQSVRAHIEQALRLNYVDAVFFPDMGHTHLFIELKKWESEYARIPAGSGHEFYSKLFADPDLKMLYHTAEQLAFLDKSNAPIMDRELIWRWQTRNLVGDNRGLGHLELLRNFQSKANTAHDYPGHYYYGAGFNLSANESGCFPYVHEGKTHYFDLSMHDLPSRATGPNWMEDHIHFHRD